MALKIIERRYPGQNVLEQKVFETLRLLAGDGVLTNHIFLPGETHAPEIDVVLFLEQKGFAIEVKNWGNRWIQLNINGPQYYSYTTPEPDREPVDKHPLMDRQNVLESIEMKARKLKSLIEIGNYQVDSVLVVPDGTTVVEAGRPSGVHISTLGDLVKNIERATAGSHSIVSPDVLDGAVERLGIGADQLEPGGILYGYKLIERKQSVREPGCPVEMEVWSAVLMENGWNLELRIYKTGERDRESATHANRRLTRTKNALYSVRNRKTSNLFRDFSCQIGEVLVFRPPFGRITLREQMNDGQALDPDLAVQLILRIADTVSELHDDGVLHLDIRPEHVCVPKKLTADNASDHVLTGLTNPRVSQKNEVIYTRTYFPDRFDASFVAERLREPDGKTKRSPGFDVYSLGALLAYCLMGEKRYVLSIQDTVIQPSTGYRSLDEVIRYALMPLNSSPFAKVADFSQSLKAAAFLRKRAGG